MAQVAFLIQPLAATDVRSNNVAVKVSVQNTGDKEIILKSLMPNISNKVRCRERDMDMKRDITRNHDELCQDMTLIIHNLKKEQERGPASRLSKLISRRQLYRILPETVKITNELTETLNSSTNFYIRNLQDAKLGYDSWVHGLDDAHFYKKLYSAKLQQLTALGNESGNQMSYIAHIPPMACYSKIYVFRFNRRHLSPTVYDYSFDATYADAETKTEYKQSASESTNISPNPFLMMLIASAFSVLGSVLKFYLSQKDVKYDHTEAFTNALRQDLIMRSGVPALITAMVFINVYDYTDIGKKMKMSASWQTAILIGVLSGLMGERLIDAIKLFIGLK